jgi:hypothetical protein
MPLPKDQWPPFEGPLIGLGKIIGLGGCGYSLFAAVIAFGFQCWVWIQTAEWRPLPIGAVINLITPLPEQFSPALDIFHIIKWMLSQSLWQGFAVLAGLCAFAGFKLYELGDRDFQRRVAKWRAKQQS